MRYNFYSDKVADVCLALSIDIVKGRYKIGEYLPKKVRLAEDYSVSRPVFDEVCEKLEKANVIQNLSKNENAMLYVPHNTNAACYVADSLAYKLRECSRLLELIGFGAREARNQLYLKQIVNTLPLKLEELEKMGKLQIHGEKQDNELNDLFDTKVIDEDIMIKTDEYSDIVNVLQKML